MAEHAALQDAEPDLYLVEPTGTRRSEVEVHVLVPGKPPIMLGPVGVEVIKHNVDLLVKRIGSDKVVHEVQELTPPSPGVVTGFDQARSCS